MAALPFAFNALLPDGWDSGSPNPRVPAAERDVFRRLILASRRPTTKEARERARPLALAAMPAAASSQHDPRALTVLEPMSTGKRLRKVILRDGTIQGADKVKTFRHEQVTFGDIHDLYGILQRLQRANRAVIRGAPACDRQPLIRQLAHTRQRGQDRGDEGFIDASRAWIALDIDKAALPAGTSWLRDPTDAVDAVLARLPEPWCDTSYVWAFTGSHGLQLDASKRWTGTFVEDVISVRVWFVLDRAVGAIDAKALMHLVQSAISNVDERVSHPIQLIYTARPHWMENPLLDPLSEAGVQTMGFVAREFDELQVPADLTMRARSTKVDGTGSGIVARHPDAEAAIRAVGQPEQGGSGRGVIRAHLSAAVRHLALANPDGTAETIVAEVERFLTLHQDEVEANLFGHCRFWDEVGVYMDDLNRSAQWYLDSQMVEAVRAGDGGGARKPVRVLLARDSDVFRAVAPSEARSAMNDTFRRFSGQLRGYRVAMTEFRYDLMDYELRRNIRDQNRKAFDALPYEDRLGKIPPKNFTELPPTSPVAPAVGSNPATGIGKTAAIIGAVIDDIEQQRSADAESGVPSFIAVPRHDLGLEVESRIKGEGSRRGVQLSTQTLRGREADDPDNPCSKMCLRLDLTKNIQNAFLDVSGAACRRPQNNGPTILCPCYMKCSFIGQQRRADVFIGVHQHLFHNPLPVASGCGAVYVDENPLNAAFFGMAERRVQAAVEQLRESLVIEGDPEGSVELQDGRERLLRVLDRATTGGLRRIDLEAEGITPEMCQLMIRLEYRRKETVESLGLRPDWPAKKFSKPVAQAAARNKTIDVMTKAWSALNGFLQTDFPSSGRVRLAVDKHDARQLRVIGVQDISNGWHAPTLISDATADFDLLRHLWPTLESEPSLVVAMEHARVFQLVDRSLSNAAIAPEDEESAEKNGRTADRNARVRRVKKLGATLVKAALQYGGQQVLAIMPIATETELLKQFKLPAWIKTAHHGAVAGLDAFKDVRAVFVIGRQLPPANSVCEMASALTGREITGGYIKGLAHILTTSGTVAVVEQMVHPDPVAEAVRRQITEAGIVQAAGRGRGVNRTEDSPLDIHLWTDVPVPPLGAVVQVLWEEIAADLDDEMLAAGCWLSNAADAAKAWPKIVVSASALRKARSRADQSVTCPYRDLPIETCHTLVRVRYRRAGERIGAADAVFVPDVMTQDPRSWLEERLGPLALFEVSDPEPAEPQAALGVEKPPVPEPILIPKSRDHGDGFRLAIRQSPRGWLLTWDLGPIPVPELAVELPLPHMLRWGAVGAGRMAAA